MERVLKIFCLEDRLADYELTKRQILKHYPSALFTRAANEAEFLEKIKRGSYDLILADYNLPGYNGLEALLHAKQHFPTVPFIFLTGTLNSEEKSAAAILKGAHGYVLKDNIRGLHEHIDGVLERSAVISAEREAARAREQSRMLKLQKSVGLLQRAGDFEGKAEIIQLIEQSMSR